LKKASGKSEKSSLRWPFVAAVLAGCIVVVLLFSFLSSRKETAPGRENQTSREKAVQTSTRQGMVLNGEAMIQAVRLQPASPTRLDTLRAEVTPLENNSNQLSYAYTWKVNEHVISDATGDSLDLSPFKKKDLVYVTVTPYREDTAGYAVSSPVIAIHSIPPSLEMKITRKTVRIGEPFELQLLSDHPDSETASFSLEEPRVDGMTIDSRTGKISWTIQPNQQGPIRFGSAVLDSEGTRVTKIFEINLNQAQAAPQTK